MSSPAKVAAAAGKAEENRSGESRPKGTRRWQAVGPDDQVPSLVELTSEGVTEQRRLSTIGGQATAQLQSGFSAEELATTRRVLTTMSERAAVLLRPSDT